MGSQDMAAASTRMPQEKTQRASQKLWGADASQTQDHTVLDQEAVQAAQRLATRYGYRVAKRLFDIMFSLLVLVLLSWVYVATAIAIKHDSEGPVFFNQERVSKDGKTFKMYKFRSMYVDAEERLKDLQDLNEKDGPVFKIKDGPRITHVGHFIRKTSIDELPQFVNVLKGDMSIVGPRPALPREVRQYTPYQKERLLVKPGITCFWQTRRNRDNISFEGLCAQAHKPSATALPWQLPVRPTESLTSCAAAQARARRPRAGFRGRCGIWPLLRRIRANGPSRGLRPRGLPSC
ncbi:MAG: sugar transferase, partial [Atopobiaceae bacterium]